MAKIREKTYDPNQIQEEKLSKDLQLENFGWDSKFYKSEPKKITVSSLVKGFFQMQDRKENSLESWSFHIGLENQTTVSKQALDNRLSPVAVQMVKTIFEFALNLKLSKEIEQEKTEQNKRLFSKFNHILIQDSTMQKLPSRLADIFKSSHSHGKKAATLRLQAIYNFTLEQWVDFDLGGFTDNDQSKAEMIAKVAQPNDLILRDLGYFTLDSLEELIAKQFVITAWDKQSHMYDPQSNQRIDLLELFKGKTQIDQAVLLGKKKQLPMRLVAKKLPKSIADKRISEAKKDRHSKTKHSKEYYKLLQWEIYLTNVEVDTLSIDEVAKLYGLRWYIEIFFKAWKSFAAFKTILSKQQMTKERTLISIYLMLIRFVYYMLDFYQYIQLRITSNSNKQISILKFFKTCAILSKHLYSIKHFSQIDQLIPYFDKYATYENRKDRDNMQLKYLYFNEL